MKYREIEKILRSQCRECMNRSYGLELERYDCVYLPYPEGCSCCGRVRNIVADISRRKRWRLWLKEKRSTHKEGRKRA